MPRPTRIEFPGALTYISIKAANDRKIFQDDIDRNRFLSILGFALNRYELKLHAYVLADEVYRLLIETRYANLTRAIQYVNSHYMAYLNTRRGSGGRIFSGRYKSVVIDKSKYLLEISRYIHMLPVRAGIVSDPARYRWSSYAWFAGSGGHNGPEVCIGDTLSFFDGPLQKQMLSYQEYAKAATGSDYSRFDVLLSRNRFLGDPDFLERALGGGMNQSPPTVDPGEVIKETARYFNASAESITDNRIKPNIPRNVAIYLCRNMTQIPLEDLGERFGVCPSSICNTAKRVEAGRKTDQELEKYIEDIGRTIRGAGGN